jgi:hypothetical protein
VGGLPCSKVIIDQSIALTSVLGRMSTSITLAASNLDTYPTDEQEDKFIELSNKLATLASEIVQTVDPSGAMRYSASDNGGSGGAGSGGSGQARRESEIRRGLDQLAPPNAGHSDDSDDDGA